MVTAPALDPLVAALTASERHGHGVYLGASLGSAGGVRPVFARPQHGVLLLGPPRSGKTTSVVVPNVLAACGPVVAASTKADVLAATCAARARLGPVLLYDPSGAVPCPAGVERVAWSPLGLAGSWDGAVLVAESMVRAARPGTDRGEASHWSERAGALLAVMFHAAALERRPFAEVVAAVDRHDPDEARAPLARHRADRALNLLEGIVATEGRELSGIWSTASGVLAGYRTDAALASTEGRQLDAAELLGGRATLYICAGSDQQRHAAPLVAGVLRQVRSAAYERCLSATVAASGDRATVAASGDRATVAASGDRATVAASGDRSTVAPRASSGPPLLLVLDELANIAPLHDLPTLVAEGASQGVLTLACLQDLAQARARWDREADGFLSLFGTKLVFPGIGDTRTLEALSLLAGEHDVPTLSVSRGSHRFGLGASRRATTRTVSLRSTRRLPVDAIARGHAGCVLGFEGVEPGFLQLTPWHATSPFREAVRDSRARSRANAPRRSLPEKHSPQSSPPGSGPLGGRRGPQRLRLAGLDRPGVSSTRRSLAGVAALDRPHGLSDPEPGVGEVFEASGSDRPGRARGAEGAFVVVDGPAPAEGLDCRCSGAPCRSVRAGRSDRAQLGLQIARPGNLRRSPEALDGGAPRRDDGNLHAAVRRGVRGGRRPGAEHHEPAAGVASPEPARLRDVTGRPAGALHSVAQRIHDGEVARDDQRRGARGRARLPDRQQRLASRGATLHEDYLSPGKAVPLRHPSSCKVRPVPRPRLGRERSEMGCEDRSGEEPAVERGSRGEQNGSSAGAQGGLDDRRELPRAHAVRLGDHDQAGGVGARRRKPTGEGGGLDAGDRLEGSGGHAPGSDRRHSPTPTR